MLDDLAGIDAQFIIAAHSPVILVTPNATILHLS